MMPKPKQRLALHLDLVELDLLLQLLEYLTCAEDDLAMWDGIESMSQPQLQMLEMIRRKVEFISKVMKLPPKGGRR